MKINVKDVERIAKELSKVERGFKTRLFYAERIQSAVNKAQKTMEKLGIPKKHQTGCTILFVPEKVANSYNGIPTGTFVTATRFPSGWFVTSIARKASGKSSGGEYSSEKLVLSTTAHDAITFTYNI